MAKIESDCGSISDSLTAGVPSDEKGRGLNSIPVSFALLGVAVGAIAFGLQYWLIFGDRLGGMSASE